MTRLTHFKQNAGLGGVFRLLFVGGVFIAIAVLLSPGLLLLCLLSGAILGVPIGFWMALRPASRGRLHKILGYGIAIGSVIAGQVWEKSAVSEQVTLGVLSLVVAFYLSSYFVFLSDSRVVIVR